MNLRLRQLEQFLNEDPDNSFLIYAMALEWISLGDDRRALGILASLLQKNPDYLPAYYICGQTALRLGENEVAIKQFRNGTVTAKIQNNRHALAELSSALEDLNEME